MTRCESRNKIFSSLIALVHGFVINPRWLAKGAPPDLSKRAYDVPGHLVDKGGKDQSSWFKTTPNRKKTNRIETIRPSNAVFSVRPSLYLHRFFHCRCRSRRQTSAQLIGAFCTWFFPWWCLSAMLCEHSTHDYTAE